MESQVSMTERSRDDTVAQMKIGFGMKERRLSRQSGRTKYTTITAAVKGKANVVNPLTFLRKVRGEASNQRRMENYDAMTVMTKQN